MLRGMPVPETSLIGVGTLVGSGIVSVEWNIESLGSASFGSSTGRPVRAPALLSGLHSGRDSENISLLSQRPYRPGTIACKEISASYHGTSVIGRF